MLQQIVQFSLQRRGLVVGVVLGLVAAGVGSAFHVAVDAVPDITSPQVTINTPVKGLAPEEIETLVTVPIEREMAGLPGMAELRSLSKFGLSQVTMTFRDGADLYRLRQLVNERLSQVRASLPADVSPALAPIATGLGEIVYYTVRYRADAPARPTDRAEQLRELRLTHDFLVKPLLRSTPGLAEVNAIGGYEKRIVIEPDPAKLAAAGVSFAQLVDVVRKNSANAGGGVLELGGEAVVVRADTRARSPTELAQLPVKFAGGAAPLLIGDLATVGIGSAVRTGASTEDGEEAVTGAAIMLAGENSRRVAGAAVARLRTIATKLPAGMEIHVAYDRSDLVNATLATVRRNLGEGALLVAAILFLVLGNWRAALIVTLAIPLSFLFLLTGLVQGQWSANLMSLGAIDFGLIVDGAVVMVENMLRHTTVREQTLRRRLTAAERVETVRTAAGEVARPMFFGVLIIALVYLPILALTGIEGKMFRPMAVAVMLAVGGALALALTLVPALCSWFLTGGAHGKPSRAMRLAAAAYAPVLEKSLRAPAFVVAAALALCVGAAGLFGRLGAEFLPQLDEGAVAIQMIRGNSVGLGDSVAMQQQAERLLREKFPEISHLFARLGTAEIAMDPMGPNTSDTYVFFHPRERWRSRDGRPIAKPELVALMRRELVATLPGQAFLFTQPVQLRFNEIMAGARADLSLKIFGEDFAELEWLAGACRDVLRGIPGGGDIEFDALGRLPMLEIVPKRDALRRLNLHTDEINAVVATALAGEEAGTLVEGSRRYDIAVRLPEAMRLDLASLRELPVRAEGDSGVQVPLGHIAELNVADRVGTITREDAQRRVAILVNVRSRDTEGFVQEAAARLRAAVPFPAGYHFEFGGQFENLQTARARLAIVVPVALALIGVLVYAALGSARQALLVYTGIPLAATGGVVGLWVRGLPFSISAAVGFIALSGVAVLNGLVLVSFFNQLRERGAGVRAAVTEGALTRLRPVAITALVASLGFLPMALSTGPGAEVQQPLATVVIGGIVSSTFLTLVVLPVLYEAVESRRRRRSDSVSLRS